MVDVHPVVLIHMFENDQVEVQVFRSKNKQGSVIKYSFLNYKTLDETDRRLKLIWILSIRIRLITLSFPCNLNR